ncbi:hypothetical protein Q3G72_016589 [Acer saccharum]|nr:hypothetical protein Q3G72_016589 [Acer saccharum]
MLVNKNVDSSNEANAAISLVGNVGLSPEDFVKLRLLCLLLSGVIQIVALRPNLQISYAVVCPANPGTSLPWLNSN